MVRSRRRLCLVGFFSALLCLLASGHVDMIMPWTMALLNTFAARWLAHRTRYHWCFAIACIECVKIPQGTLLGVFTTLVVLLRPGVKAPFTGERLPELDADD